MNVLVTGSSGLIGSEAVEFFDKRAEQVIGIDNNMRMDFFGPDGDTRWNLRRLRGVTERFIHYDIDIRDREAISHLFADYSFDLIIHCAAQPSHDLAKDRPFDDFDVNAVGTMNLLEATRSHCPEAVFIFMSTNKVYGDAPNEKEFAELETRWDYKNETDYNGIDETCRIDQSTHSIFGASKVAADIMAQEYGRYFDLKTCCLRGGCLTGPRHSGVELHGFLSHLVKTVVKGISYTIFGYKGKQVRDNIHSSDVVSLFYEIYKNPKYGEVYNIGGGRRNSISIIEAFDKVELLTGKKATIEYSEKNRVGDHICYITDLSKVSSHFGNWSITKNIDEILEEMVLNEITGDHEAY